MEKGSSATAWKPGNLLTYNQQSVETDLTGLSGYHGTLTRSTSEYCVGTASAKLATTSDGNVTINTPFANAVPVVAGNMYLALIKTKQNVINKGVNVNLVWYNSGGSQISASSSPNTFSKTSWFSKSVVGMAPATATKCGIALELQSVLIGNELYWDDAWLVEMTSQDQVAGITATVPVSDGKQSLTETPSITATVPVIEDIDLQSEENTNIFAAIPINDDSLHNIDEVLPITNQFGISVEIDIALDITETINNYIVFQLPIDYNLSVEEGFTIYNSFQIEDDGSALEDLLIQVAVSLADEGYGSEEIGKILLKFYEFIIETAKDYTINLDGGTENYTVNLDGDG